MIEIASKGETVPSGCFPNDEPMEEPSCITEENIEATIWSKADQDGGTTSVEADEFEATRFPAESSSRDDEASHDACDQQSGGESSPAASLQSSRESPYSSSSTSTSSDGKGAEASRESPTDSAEKRIADSPSFTPPTPTGQSQFPESNATGPRVLLFADSSPSISTSSKGSSESPSNLPSPAPSSNPSETPTEVVSDCSPSDKIPFFSSIGTDDGNVSKTRSSASPQSPVDDVDTLPLFTPLPSSPADISLQATSESDHDDVLVGHGVSTETFDSATSAMALENGAVSPFQYSLTGSPTPGSLSDDPDASA